MAKTPREFMRALMEAVVPPKPDAAPAPKLSAKSSFTKLMQTLPDYYHEIGSSSSATNHIYRGRGNRDLPKIVAYLKSNGYQLRLNRGREQEWSKVTGMPYGETSRMRSHHAVSINHNGDSVVSIQHSNSMY